MEKLEFRLLDKEEIECRVQSITKDNSGCILLLYKTARTDYNLLDEVVGAMNWKCDYKEIKGNLYCEIAIYNKDLQQWISKSNCGVESNTEAEKGEASDSLKRAGFVWGIGRELYTAPFTYIKLTSDDFSNIKLKTTFRVKEIGYTNRVITKLVIEDNKGNVRFKYGNVENAENKGVESVKVEIIEPNNKTSKTAKRTSDNTKITTEKFIEAHVEDLELPFDTKKEEKVIENLTELHDTIARLNFQLGKDTTKCYEYFCKLFNKKSVEDLERVELETIIKKLEYNVNKGV